MICTDSGSLRWARLDALTSTWLPAATPAARIPPFTPLTSSRLPAAIRPLQWNSVWAGAGTAAPISRAQVSRAVVRISIVLAIVVMPGFDFALPRPAQADVAVEGLD